MADFDEEQHPRDEHGRFAGSGLSAWATKKAGTLLGKAEREGGFSYRPLTGAPKRGFMVSRAPKEGLGHIVDIAKMAKDVANREPPLTEAEVRAEVHKETLGAIKKWLEKNTPEVMNRPDHYFGGWIQRHNETGEPIALHLDVSQNFPDKARKRAIKEGRARNQMSIWDVTNKREIETGGTGR